MESQGVGHDWVTFTFTFLSEGEERGRCWECIWNYDWKPNIYPGVGCVVGPQQDELKDTHTAAAAAAAASLQSCLTLCDPIDGSTSGFPVPGILQARTLEWVAISFSNAWKWKVKVKSPSRVQLSDPMDCSLPGSSVHGIFQAKVLEWGAIAFSNTHTMTYQN